MVYEILKYQNPETFKKLCEVFKIKKEELCPSSGEIGWFDAAFEMTHDSEGRYLDYTGGRKK